MNDLIIGLITSLSHTFGGNLGCAIIVLSLGIRVALLPLTIKLARRARRNQEIIRTLQPEIEQLKKLNKVCFSRKSFSGIPKMKERIESIRLYCQQWGIHFEYLTTPARFYRADKQDEWTEFLNGDKQFRASRFISDGSEITIIKKDDNWFWDQFALLIRGS